MLSVVLMGLGCSLLLPHYYLVRIFFANKYHFANEVVHSMIKLCSMQ